MTFERSNLDDIHPAAGPENGGVETAGHLAVRDVPLAVASEPAAAVRSRLVASSHQLRDLIMITDESGAYQGVVDAGRLLGARPDDVMGALVVATWPVVEPQIDQEHAAQIAAGAGVSALPVVSDDGRPVGIVPGYRLLDVLSREHREDVDRLVGILRDQSNARQASTEPPLVRVQRRLPWLLVGIALSAGATGLMASFEDALKSNVTIAFFIPALVYLTDAIGTQTEAVTVRSLSLQQGPAAGALFGELITGAVIGFLLGALATIGIWMAFGSFAAGLGVGLSLFFAGTLACGIGLVLPWGLAKAGMDPAFGAGPVATIIQDVLTILVYFLIMTRVVGA